MGKDQKKTGKGRLDKWYQLAKEQGYRARSAFKLVQLNRKYDFLASARCVIDLCAAPGGWLQVAAKQMPTQNSIIIGVDLVPIKPIPRCVTLVEDITTESCRRALRAEMKDWKADVVLHDGAPNVGSAWVQDAFTQVELVLASLKLAVEFLRPGGTFCTKVFRSKDYNSLLWVFNQLFTKVEATKPPSSRNVSAEIFVVCQGYLAPAKIDPKLLNPKFVFAEADAVGLDDDEGDKKRKITEIDAATDDVDAESGKKGSKKVRTNVNPLAKLDGKAVTTKDVMTPASLNVFAPEKKRKQREGYDDEDRILYRECRVMEWVRHQDPIGVLSMVNKMTWADDEDKKLLKSPLTTSEIKACLEDLKVLGKKDFKMLLKYRAAIREDLGLDIKVDEKEEVTETVEVQPLDEEEQITRELERLAREEALKKRRDRRRVNEKKQREVQRMQLNMVTPMDIGLERQDGVDDADMFDLGEVEGGKERRGVNGELGSDADGVLSEDDEEEVMRKRQRRMPLNPIPEAALAAQNADDDDEDVSDTERRTRRLEESLDILYDSYQQSKLERDAKHKVKEQRRKKALAEGGEFKGLDDEEAQDSDEESEESDGIDSDPAPQPSDDEDDSSDEEEEQTIAPAASTSKAGLITSLKQKKVLSTSAKSRQAAMWFDQPAFKGLPGGGLEALLGGRGTDDEDDETDGDEEDASEDYEGVRTVWDEMGERLEGEDEVGDESDEESDDDFRGAREEYVEDEDMEDEADIDAQEQAEVEKSDRIAKLGLTTAEAMTLAQQLVNQERTKTQLVDEGFNRHTDIIGGDGLPTWFIDDEQRHLRHNIPVTKEAVQAIRDKQRALNARPIKKVAEAKARKKMRQIRRLEKMRAKAQGINDDEENGLTEKEKAASIAKILAKSSKAGKQKKPETKVVVARGANRGIKGRPNGVKGKYKIVDPRQKKEVRALKRIAKRERKNGGRRKANK
ncbi:adoMet-dependent rRNA methyltransferase spb1 [Rhodotorula toruloides]|uniref:AdoMet-dependent rRNA methyltransferase spb1 n=1 Tax=Rhodotorula toruloides TaxID=5286 RepID=A0A511KEI5_RHOTO|nr:adoMet-dependent rRNA methyltransferase spb1 [Rhodotorula toruloides]